MPKTIMPTNVSPRLRALKVFVSHCPVGMRYPNRESHEALGLVLVLVSKAGGMDLGGPFRRCGWLADVFLGDLGDDRVEGKAGRSMHSSLSSAGGLLGIGEGETDGEVLLLASEFGRDESDDELV